MKLITLFIIFLFIVGTIHAQSNNKEYDSALAKKLNADDYGMRKYFLVMLKTGPAVITGKARLDSIFAGHMKNIQWLAAQNKLVVAGPLGKNDKNYEGIFILNAESREEAEKLLETDTAIQLKLLTAEYYSLYSSAAMQQVPGIHRKIEKNSF